MAAIDHRRRIWSRGHSLLPLLRWTGRVLFLTGLLALGYVCFILLDARVYQAHADRLLDSQIETPQVSGLSVPRQIKSGDVLARLEVPRLAMSVVVLQGTTSHILRRGVGHIEGTVLPGELGNSGIAGHRDTFFRALKDIQPSDKVELQTAAGLSHYEVEWTKVVAPDDLSVLAPSTETTLTLVTCYPFYFIGGAPKRFVVHARLLPDPSGPSS